MLYDLIYKQRSPLGKMGAPYDFYLLSDLADGRFSAEAYKAVIFLNAVNLEEPVKQAIPGKAAEGRPPAAVDLPGGRCQRRGIHRLSLGVYPR